MRSVLIICFLLVTQLVVGQNTFIKKTWFDSEKTKIKEVITLNKSDSTLHGLYNSFFENGSLSISGYYQNGKSDSLWTYYFENGREKAKGAFNNDLKQRKWNYYYENGRLKASGLYNNDLRHGYWEFYFENGSEKSTGIYFEDQKEGIWNYFYEEGSLKAQAYYENGSGPYKEFYPSGAIRAEGENHEDQSEGEWVYYYETGEIEIEGNFEDGIRQRFWQYFHKNGQVAAEGRYEDGQKSGVWKYYYPDGSVSSEGAMTSDQKDGFWKLYYQTGEVKAEGTYDQGNGDYMEYYANGKIKAKGMIENGLKEGKWTYYTEEGIEDGIATFNNGYGEYYGYYSDGTTKMTGKIENDRRVGTWTLYNPDGTVAGTYTPVYEEEKPIFRTGYVGNDDDRSNIEKPSYRPPNRRVKYFNPRINEFKGFIFGTNPLWMAVGQLPIAGEYYIQERLGYEAEVTIHNKPFFQYQTEINTNDLFKEGADIAIRQKFYNSDENLGMFYFSHQVMFGFINHGSNILDSTDTSNPPVVDVINLRESRLGYGIFIGNRWMERAGDSGFTIDFNVGIGIGSRFIRKDYDASSEYDQVFDELNQREIYLPIIFTLNLGFAGPKRRTTSF